MSSVSAPMTSGLSLIPLTLGVTGHRAIAAHEIPPCRDVFSMWLHGLIKAYPQTPLRLLSGLAEGADRVAAQTFLELRDSEIASGNAVAKSWELIALLPMEADEYQLDFPNSVQDFQSLLGKADDVIVLPTPHVGALADPAGWRDGCYETLGRHIVRHANILVAIWDGLELDLRGGTSHVVRLKRDGLEGSRSGFSVAMHDRGPIWHIRVQREESVSGASPQANGVAGSWIYPRGLQNTVKQFDGYWQAIETFNQQARLLERDAAVSKQMAYLSPSTDHQAKLLEDLKASDRKVLHIQAVADLLAQRTEIKRRRLIWLMYALGGLLAFCLWTALDGVDQLAMAAAYLVIVVSIVGLFQYLKRPELTDDPIFFRFLAEALRIQFYWSIEYVHQGDDGTSHHASEQSSRWEILRVLEALLSQQAQELAWVKEALRIGALNPRTGQQVDPATRDVHLNHWVSDQLSYFKKAQRRDERRSVTLRRGSLALFLIGLMAAASVLFIDTYDPEKHELRHVASIAAAVLPALVLILQSYVERMALEEQVKSYQRMASIFGRAQEVISAYRNQALPSSFFGALGREALGECAYWLILRKSKPPAMPT